MIASRPGAAAAAASATQRARRPAAAAAAVPTAAAAAAPARSRPQAPRRAHAAAARGAAETAAAAPAPAPAGAAAAHLRAHAAPAAAAALAPYADAEAALSRLLATPDIDAALAAAAEGGSAEGAAAAAAAAAASRLLLSAVAAAMDAAYGPDPWGAKVSPRPGAAAASDALGAGRGAGGALCSQAAFTLCDLPPHGGGGAAAAAWRDAAGPGANGGGVGGGDPSAHLFLQRVLYRINRLQHFWFDPLSSYSNERSLFLQRVRGAVERRWQLWEASRLPGSAVELLAACGAGGAARSVAAEALRERYARDVDPPASPALAYVRDAMGPLGYAHLLALGSVDGLVEASRQSRVCAGAANPVSCAIFRVLSEEYGGGRPAKKHSTFYRAMMLEAGLDAREEAYLDLLPWEVLANANNSFLLTERRRHYLRYAGALSFFEINGPAVYHAYLAAARRCGLSDGASGYWQLHIKEDERHGRQMLDEVALPLVDMYPENAWELLLGYEQEAFLGARAGAAVAQAIQAAEARAAAAAAAKAGAVRRA
ncbi:hypothetical protein Rsub_12449 [Raphidocelis subcapitata]|uniref:Uncharacterized protein n=1 Tax=Raphidocelis subcapitata TaxID=307507 RepID=A0A2V0PJ48_9CHLO|nr:hypothetical protein Rsub_12449 [Raphidocelis subcapitata]|eukprot:GBF99736.1 hypothetical protein Rsub_12449 [Raphidocelis subcapitata]